MRELKEGFSDLLRLSRQVLYRIFIPLDHLFTSPSLHFTPFDNHIDGAFIEEE
jgi:hypothetical protein